VAVLVEQVEQARVQGHQGEQAPAGLVEQRRLGGERHEHQVGDARRELGRTDHGAPRHEGVQVDEAAPIVGGLAPALEAIRTPPVLGHDLEHPLEEALRAHHIPRIPWKKSTACISTTPCCSGVSARMR
jgi:hypothetical protein